MTSNLRIIEKGSNYISAEWDSSGNGSSYIVQLLNTSGKIVSTTETEKTSITFDGLNTSTTYNIRLMLKGGERYIKIRIQQNSRTWFSLTEVEAYNENNTKLPKNHFNFRHTRLHPLTRGHTAMDGRKHTNSSWRFGSMMYRNTPQYWEASFKPTALKEIQIYTNNRYKLVRGARLIMTKENGKTEVYTLDTNKYHVRRNIPTHQRIRF